MLSLLNKAAPWGLLIIAVAWIWYDHTHPRMSTQVQMVEMPIAAAVDRVEFVEIPCKTIMVLKKDKAVKRLKVPESIKRDESAQIATAGDIPAYEGSTTVTAIFNTGSGEVSLLSRREPLPFWAFMNDKELGLRYGMTDEGTGFDLYGRMSFLRVGRVRASLYVEASSSTAAKAMLELGYKF